jgi:hypothetical protein
MLMFKKLFSLVATLGLLVGVSSCGTTDTNYDFGVGLVAEPVTELASTASVELTQAVVVFNSKGAIVEVNFETYSVPFFVNGDDTLALGVAGETTYLFETTTDVTSADEIEDSIKGYTIEQIIELEGIIDELNIPVNYLEALAVAYDLRTADVDYDTAFARQRVGTILDVGHETLITTTDSGLSFLTVGVVTNINDKVVISHFAKWNISVVAVDGAVVVGDVLPIVIIEYSPLAHWTVAQLAADGQLVLSEFELDLDLVDETVAFNNALNDINKEQLFGVPAVVVPELPVEEPVDEEETTEPETEEPVDEEETEEPVTEEPVEETPEEGTEEPVTEEPSDEEDPVEETPVDEEETTEEEPANP